MVRPHSYRRKPNSLSVKYVLHVSLLRADMSLARLHCYSAPDSTVSPQGHVSLCEPNIIKHNNAKHELHNEAPSVFCPGLAEHTHC